MTERIICDGVVEDNDYEENREKEFWIQVNVTLLLNKLQISVEDRAAYRDLQDSIIAVISNEEYSSDSDIQPRVKKIIHEGLVRCRKFDTSTKILEEIFPNFKEEEFSQIPVKEFIKEVGKFLKSKQL